jgi:hypothetical protein
MDIDARTDSDAITKATSLGCNVEFVRPADFYDRLVANVVRSLHRATLKMRNRKQRQAAIRERQKIQKQAQKAVLDRVKHLAAIERFTVSSGLARRKYRTLRENFRREPSER